MHAILIDPKTQFITSLSIDADDYECIRQVIGCESLTVAASLPTNDTVFVDRAALVNEAPRHCFRFAGSLHATAGRAVVVGNDHVGDSVDAHTSADALRQLVTYEHPKDSATRSRDAWTLA